MYRPSKHTSLRQATVAHIQVSNMPLSKTHEIHHSDKTASPGMETTASHIPEPVRPRNSSNNQTTAKLPIFVGDEQTRHAKEMPGTSAQSTSGDPQDNGSSGHDRQALDFHQHPNRLPVVNDKTGKAVNPARYPYLKPLDTTCMPDGWAVISPKRKARLQGKSSAPNSYAAAAQANLKNEAAKDEGGFPPPKRQRRNASPPCHTVVTHDSPTARRMSPPSAASMITVISEVGPYEAMRIPTATTHFTGGELNFHDARLSCVLPQDFPYPLAKIDKPVEEEGMLKFDVTWKPVFVSFAQIRGQPAAAENLAVNIPTFAASKSCYNTCMDTVVPNAATTFSIETFKSWEMVLHNGERTLLLEVYFPDSLVEFKDLNGAETMNEARKLVVETFGKAEGNRLLRIQPSR
ncbi:hypothetical protein PG984_000035 [Apiospora sp. TS-2023a]